MEHCQIEEYGISEVPSLIKYISSNEVTGFYVSDLQYPCLSSIKSEIPSAEGQVDEPVTINHQKKHLVSINMPLSCEEVQPHNSIKVLCSGETDLRDGIPISSSQISTEDSKHPLPSKNSEVHLEAISGDNFANHQSGRYSHILFSNNRFDSFKTWSGKLEKQLSILSGRSPTQTVQEDCSIRNTDRPLPVHRYFDALEGPELETLRASEEIVFPLDNQWPFPLRFPISSFGICLGVSSQAILWKALALSPSTEFLHISLKINFILWFISIALTTTIFTIYLLKIILYFEAVRCEYHHPIRVNFFFAPWIALLFLALGAPPSLTKNLHHALWYILMVPLVCLELKIYGQWMSGGQRRLSKVANPSNHLSIVGNFVGALLGASMGLKEGPMFFFAVGFAHYIVLFVTLYQRLPTNETLPKDLHPVFFLFVAAPSVASVAWARIQGSFDYRSRIAYFIAMFLYFSLAIRVNFFRGFKFSLSWWAYTFPMTGAAIATINYSNQVTNVMTKALSTMLSLTSSLIVTALLCSTILHAFVLRDLFPNDLAIAISNRKRKPNKKGFQLRHGHAKEIENYLKFVNSDKHDLEASVTITPSFK
ncbi:putative voltage-dependent anion channel [Lupinus albus]|uniref:Putative voltage-dependent anion channel n=1 Tax=Lupinus albus TaxID=3870 RepID=A0A6A4QVB7_LUPAL|nr:putative voltage-dependent anion channel [Lupinus albus]